VAVAGGTLLTAPAAAEALAARADGGFVTFLTASAAGFAMWHFGQKKNPASIAVIVRQVNTTIAVIASGPTGFGNSGSAECEEEKKIT
jgi:hypothetical protein